MIYYSILLLLAVTFALGSNEIQLNNNVTQSDSSLSTTMKPLSKATTFQPIQSNTKPTTKTVLKNVVNTKNTKPLLKTTTVLSTTKQSTTNSTTISMKTSTVSITTNKPLSSKFSGLSTKSMTTNSPIQYWYLSFDLSYDDRVFNNDLKNSRSEQYRTMKKETIKLINKSLKSIGYGVEIVKVENFRNGSIIAEIRSKFSSAIETEINKNNFIVNLLSMIQGISNNKKMSISNLELSKTEPVPTTISMTTVTTSVPVTTEQPIQLFETAYSLKITFYNHKWNSNLDNKLGVEYEKAILSYTDIIRMAHLKANYILDQIAVTQLEKGSIVAHVKVQLLVPSVEKFDVPTYLLKLQDSLESPESTVFVQLEEIRMISAIPEYQNEDKLSDWAIAVIVIICLAMVIIVIVIIIKCIQMKKLKAIQAQEKKEFDDMKYEGNLYPVRVYQNEAYDHAYDMK